MSQQSRSSVKGYRDVLRLPNDPYMPFLPAKPAFIILYNHKPGVSYWGQPMPITDGHVKTSDKRPIRLRGRIRWFNTTKAYGYIAPEDGTHDILLDQTESAGDNVPMKALFHEGDCVEFEVSSNHQHRPTATNVRHIIDPTEKHGRTKKMN